MAIKSEQELAQEYLLEASNAFEQIKSYAALNEYTEWKGRQCENSLTHFYFRKPGSQAFEIIKSSNPLATGGMAHYSGGSVIKAKRKILFSYIRLDVELTNAFFRSIRGYSMHIGYFPNLYARVLREELPKERAGTEIIHGRAAILVDIWGTGQFFDPEVTRERLAFDTETYALVQNEMYGGSQGDQLIARSVFRQVRLNAPLWDAEPLKL